MLYELHAHSSFSDGLASPLEIVAHAKRRLDGIAITDHDVINGSLEALKYSSPDFTVIAGVEVSSVQGHILALFVRELVPKGLTAKETVEAIHSFGGLAIAAHPYDRYRRGVKDLILKLPFDAVEVVNGHTFTNISDPAEVCLGAGIPMVGGSDAHTLREIGSVATEFKGDFVQAVEAGAVGVKSRPLFWLMVNHGVGIVERKMR